MDIDTNMQMIMAEENAVKDILKQRIEGLQTYKPENVELLSYRLAEIMILAKDLYTKLFQDLMKSDTSSEKEMWNQIMGIRMHLLHMKDCIDDFDSSMLELMEDRDEAEGEEEDFD